MLKISKIERSEVPEFVLNNIRHVLNLDDFIEFYKSEGMFGNKTDYLLVVEITENKNENKHYGYVYNGNDPTCSEFGSFGLNDSKTERIW